MKSGSLEVKKLRNFHFPMFLSSLLILISSYLLSAFPIGEQLEYTAKFGFLNIGKMTLEITDTITCQNRKCYRLCSQLNSNKSLGFLFSLNDTIEVYATQDSLLPLFYEERINEGNYQNYSKLFFNQDSLFVVYNDTLRLEILENTRDLLSFWYYLRTIPLLEGDTINLNIHKSKENHKIGCLVGQKEVIKTGLGKFTAIRVVPKTEGKGIFGKKGGMEIWYTDDEKKYPVQIKTRMKFGSIIFKLKGVKN